MNGHTLVQVEQPTPVGTLDDLDVLVERRLLVDGPGLRLDCSGRDERKQRESTGGDEVADPEQECRGDGDERRGDQKGSLRSDRGDEHERRQERADQRARGRERVQAARDGPGERDVGHRESNGERRHHPEQHDRRGEEEEYREEASDDGPERDLVEPLHGPVEKGLCDEGDRRDGERAAEHEKTENRRARMPVRDSPSDPVAESECCQDDPDQVRPDDRGGAEVRLEET